MAKFDEHTALPKIFSDNNLSILPISRKQYIISGFETHFLLSKEAQIEQNTKVSVRQFPSDINSIVYDNIHHEQAALLSAYHSGILQEVVGEPVKLTVLGRMTTGKFNFMIKSTGATERSDSYRPIEVENAQIEIDGGFEGENIFAIIEAKAYFAQSISIRQLYYPYRLWKEKLPMKNIIPILMLYSGNTYIFYMFSFEDELVFNSIKVKAVRKYQINPPDMNIYNDDISRLFARVQVEPEPEISPPQADTFEIILDLLAYLDRKPRSVNDLVEWFGQIPIVRRQKDYYILAAQYLNLIDSNKVDEKKLWSLTNQTQRLLRMNFKERRLALIEMILKRKIFYETFILMSQKGGIPSKEEIATLIVKYSRVPLSGETPGRRANTVRSWLRWIINQTADNTDA